MGDNEPKRFSSEVSASHDELMAANIQQIFQYVDHVIRVHEENVEGFDKENPFHVLEAKIVALGNVMATVMASLGMTTEEYANFLAEIKKL